MDQFTDHRKRSMISLDDKRHHLLRLAREGGDRYFDRERMLCLIQRDTVWYAIGLLFDERISRRQLGETLLAAARSEDGTHTPATLVAILRGVPDLLPVPTREHLKGEVLRDLVPAAEVIWRDGNVNHPLGAFCALICGGELCDQPWAVELGYRRLEELRRMTGDRHFCVRRQAEMSEYNSLTYTALDLCFLALIAEYAEHPRARALARFFEEQLWLDVAMHFHAPSLQFAGPHSRSYQDDSTGGFSALHCVWHAVGLPATMNDDLAYRFRHPSTLVQNGLVAIVPFHVSGRARRMALEKPLPYGFRKTTYGEHYHENSRRTTPDASGKTVFAFDDEIYAGGLSDLTTYMTDEFALGTASLPYVNAGHSDSVVLRMRSTDRVRGMGDFRSMYTRGVYNDAIVGKPNFSHVAQTEIDESYLYEEGRCATFQHRNRAMVCYAPKRAGHMRVKSFRLDCIFGYWSPFDHLLLDGKHVHGFPVNAGRESRLVFQNHRTFGCVIMLGPEPFGSEHPIRLQRAGEFLLFSAYNYSGDHRDVDRDEISLWRTGCYLEVGSADEYAGIDAWLEHVARLDVCETLSPDHVRHVMCRDGKNTMEMKYDPVRERILSRRWNGAEEQIVHFDVDTVEGTSVEFRPVTLFGREAMETGA
jgi:hypothetical protein